MEILEEISKIEDLDLTSFLSRARVSQEQWDAAKIEWEVLQKIGADHQMQFGRLSDTAAMYANDIQRIEKVHSVRWRVKDTLHLLEKIVRKRAKNESKYLEIKVENYYEIVTDLIGIRAIHLFKDDCFEIDPKIRSNWVLTEKPLAYVRAGDPDDFIGRLKAADFVPKSIPTAIDQCITWRQVSRWREKSSRRFKFVQFLRKGGAKLTTQLGIRISPIINLLLFSLPFLIECRAVRMKWAPS